MILCFGTTPAIARTMQFTSLHMGEVNRTREVYTYAAGKAVNAARVIHTLGEEVVCMGVQGGMLGPGLVTLLERDKISHQFLRTTAPTRLVITVVDGASASATELIEDAPPMTPEDGEELLTQLRLMLDGVRVAVFSGSLARGLSADYYARCIRLAHERGAQVVLDASGEALQVALREKPQVIKINAHELAGLRQSSDFPDEGSLIAAARSVAEQTQGQVIVTRGQKGTIAVDRGGSAWKVGTVVPQRVISPIGSGDSFAAGVAVGLSRGRPLERLLALGTACAVANVETPHAAHFAKTAVTKKVDSIIIERI